MYITEIIIDGFKSYAQRTVISGFDPYFNAITGLNGSGKSNILDAICFVLGISNLSQVRAGSLQELVYKQGQAGVSRATVTIVFDNADKASSPVGYEDYEQITVTRQVIIGGKNKYLINGHNAQLSRVQNLFHSVQLNVNNPHFLIMQGRITKVLNMKPPEIKAMIEEAAGTRMFEAKKQAALKTIEKKDSKLHEITAILNDEITPKLEKLRKERTSYLDYQKTQMECEHIQHLCIAYDFVQAEEALRLSSAELDQITAQRASLELQAQQCEQRIQELNGTIAELEHKRSAEAGEAYRECEGRVGELSKALVKANANWQHRQEAAAAERKTLASLERNRAELTASVARAETELVAARERHASLERAAAEAAAALEQLQQKVHGFTLGTADASGVKTLTSALGDAKAAVQAAKTEVQQCDMKIKHAEEDLKRHAKASQGAEKEYARLTKQHQAAVAALEKARAELEAIAIDPTAKANLQQARETERKLVAGLTEKYDAAAAKLNALDFAYADPVPDFDRRRVRGLVANLITVRDPAACTAIEVAAGGKLYNVVVDTEETGKLLLSGGQLKRRVTIVPLNKIASRTPSADAVRVARDEGQAQLAIELIGYEADVDAAMRYVFGSTFVCRELDAARRVTFHKGVMTRSVTLDGDVFDPAGTLTGGSRTQPGASILQQLEQVRALRADLEAHRSALRDIEARLGALQQSAAQVDVRTRERDVRQHATELAQAQLEQCPFHQHMQEKEKLEAALAALRKEREAALERVGAAEKRCEQIEHEIAASHDARANEVELLQAELAKAKKASAAAAERRGKAQRELDTIAMDIENSRTELAALEQQVLAAQAAIGRSDEDVRLSAEELAERKAAFERANDELAERRARLALADSAIAEQRAELDAMQRRRTEGDLEAKRQAHRLERITKERKEAAQAVEHLLAKHPWIGPERAQFGRPNSIYDFSPASVNDARRRLGVLRDAQQRLSKSVNMKVINMFGKAEQEYADLMKKKHIVEKDRNQIHSTIGELDRKKNEALQRTYEQVNRDFDSIFSSLLPGTHAKLAPVDGESASEGLEVKVAFGDVWKDSLTELSGGQRSLVALSLILAMLLFKPAPMYILDEVDAALDLSHTQNIGHMLRTHFARSQFIVVSLKDGMFNNANVLFRTKFVDGVSTVTRTVQSQQRAHPPSGEKENDDRNPPRSRAKAAGQAATKRLRAVAAADESGGAAASNAERSE